MFGFATDPREKFCIHTTEYDLPHEASRAKEILGILIEAYPGYSWHAKYKGGMIQIQVLDPVLRHSWGAAIPQHMVAHDAAVLKQKVISAGGELLERLHLCRRANIGEKIEVFEGVPEEHQPIVIADQAG